MPFFILATLLMPLVLLNILIAIMGDSFGRAKDDAVSIDAKERIAMISEISSTAIQLRKIASFLAKKKPKEPQKFYVLTWELYEAQETNSTVEDLISEQNIKIQAVKDEIQTMKDEIQSNTSTVTKGIQNVQAKLENDIQMMNQNIKILLERSNKGNSYF